MASANVTQLLVRYSHGDKAVHNEILEVLYQELNIMARQHLRREHAQTMQATELVHEAYLKLVDQKNASWQNRSHFLAICSCIMRRLLVDRARNRGAIKRGAGLRPVTLEVGKEIPDLAADDARCLAIDDALEKLKMLDDRQFRVVEMKFFGGMEVTEIAEALSISAATVKRDWRVAKAWLNREIRNQEGL